MRLAVSLSPAFIIAAMCFSASVCPGVRAEDSATYEWTDDQGTVTFSDNPARIPDNQRKRIKKRAAITGEASQAVIEQKTAPVKKQQPQRVESYGGHGEGWWRQQFSNTRAEIAQTRADLETKRQNLKTLHYKMAVSNATTQGIFGNPRENRNNYRAAHDDIREGEKQLEALEQKLVDLEGEAARHGVPFEWRR